MPADGEPLRAPTNPRVKAVVALHGASERRRTGLHVAEGPRVCREALGAGLVRTLHHVGPLPHTVGPVPADVDVVAVDERVMARMSDAATPPGVLAVVRTPVVDDVPPTGPLLVLDGVGDPGNVGTLVRSAAAFGLAVLALGGADPFGPKAVRASAGACYRTPVMRRGDATDAEVLLRGAGRLVVGLDAAGAGRLEAVAAAVPPAGFALVAGSEPHGLSGPVRAAVDTVAAIPMHGDVESLNVGAAAAVAMFALTGS